MPHRSELLPEQSIIGRDQYRYEESEWLTESHTRRWNHADAAVLPSTNPSGITLDTSPVEPEMMALHSADWVPPGQTDTRHEGTQSELSNQLASAAGKSQLQALVSVSALQLPVSEILLGLAAQTGLELFITANLKTGSLATLATLSAKSRPLEDILNLLAAQAGFAWEFERSLLRIFPDEAYLKTYEVDYLNITRSTQSSVDLATQVGSINLALDGGGNSAGHSNNSRTLIENTTTHDFWTQLESDLQNLLQLSGEQKFEILVNKEAGLVTARCRFEQHLEVTNYLKSIQQSIDRQVLIEATVVEVSLSDQHRTGVDWRIIGQQGSSGDGLQGSQHLHGQSLPGRSSPAGSLQSLPSALLGFVQRSSRFGNISATLDLLREFGDVKILSQPMIMAMNNQSAVLKVVDNRVYFSVNVERNNQSDSGREEVTTQTRIHTVPVGLVMNVMPFISAHDRVVLNIRPTISRILGFVNDPNPELGLTNIQNGVPEIQVREMESVLTVKSGHVAVIGGLMQESSNSSQTGFPYLEDVPLLGSLFRKKQRRTGKTELLVFLRPTIITTGSDDFLAHNGSVSLQ